MALNSSHQLQFPTNSHSQSQSLLQSPREKQQLQPVSPWSAHASPSRQSPSPFLRHTHTLSTSATAVGELFLFGGYTGTASFKSPSNDLYVFSTRDFSTTLLRTSGDVPSSRYGHRAVLTSTTLLIWGGATNHGNRNAPLESNDDSLYLLNLVSREWTRIAGNDPGPGGRCYHTMTLVDSKLFVFGGWSSKGWFNDIWSLDLNCSKSNLSWELYEPTPGNEKPLPRANHVSVTTGDRIIIFGGGASPQLIFNDTWSFDISTRKWTMLQCTGSVPSPRVNHAAVLVDDVMYVFGGRTIDGNFLCDLTALNLSTQRWTAFQDIGPSPSGRESHAMACDGTRVFMLGGRLSTGTQFDEAKPIHILDTKLLVYPKPDSNTVKHKEKTIQLAQKLSVGHLTQGQPRPPTLDHHADLERQLPETLAERAQLTDQLAQKSALLEQAEANAAEVKERAELERRDLQARLDDSLLSRDQAEANAAEVKERAELEQRELQATLDDLLLSRDQALEQARSALQSAAEVNETNQRELAEVHAKLEARESELAAVRL